MFFGKRYLFSGKMISPYAFILARRERWFFVHLTLQRNALGKKNGVLSAII